MYFSMDIVKLCKRASNIRQEKEMQEFESAGGTTTDVHETMSRGEYTDPFKIEEFIKGFFGIMLTKTMIRMPREPMFWCARRLGSVLDLPNLTKTFGITLTRCGPKHKHTHTRRHTHILRHGGICIYIHTRHTRTQTSTHTHTPLTQMESNEKVHVIPRC